MSEMIRRTPSALPRTTLRFPMSQCLRSRRQNSEPRSPLMILRHALSVARSPGPLRAGSTAYGTRPGPSWISTFARGGSIPIQRLSQPLRPPELFAPGAKPATTSTTTTVIGMLNTVTHGCALRHRQEKQNVSPGECEWNPFDDRVETASACSPFGVMRSRVVIHL